jgi:WhiB family redox-sensing transcriptional regulator
MTSRHEQDAAPTDRARARPQFPAAMNAAAFRRLPAPVTEIWDWQLWGVCRGLDGNLFFHPDHERGPARAGGEERAKQACRTGPVMQQCTRHALSVREPYGVWGGLSKSERDALLGGGHRPTRVAPPGSAA